ncbi:hypothetical protein DFH06DRAFT_1293905 [Mycena polygramma]|nr:hypothetical protein DFH06DRAFT_1293905 [Mycena polygramma]
MQSKESDAGGGANSADPTPARASSSQNDARTLARGQAGRGKNKAIARTKTEESTRILPPIGSPTLLTLGSGDALDAPDGRTVARNDGVEGGEVGKETRREHNLEWGWGWDGQKGQRKTKRTKLEGNRQGKEGTLENAPTNESINKQRIYTHVCLRWVQVEWDAGADIGRESMRGEAGEWRCRAGTAGTAAARRRRCVTMSQDEEAANETAGGRATLLSVLGTVVLFGQASGRFPLFFAAPSRKEPKDGWNGYNGDLVKMTKDLVLCAPSIARVVLPTRARVAASMIERKRWKRKERERNRSRDLFIATTITKHGQISHAIPK